MNCELSKIRRSVPTTNGHPHALMLREDHDVSANLINMMLQRPEADSNNIDAPWQRDFELADDRAVEG